MNDTPFDIEVFFDGECPLCSREIAFLRSRDRRSRIRFTDIAARGFDASTTGIAFEALMGSIHGSLPDGTIIGGVEVFRALYEAIGFGPIVALTRLPGARALLDFAYEKFAARRLALTGRCTPTSCGSPTSTGALR